MVNGTLEHFVLGLALGLLSLKFRKEVWTAAIILITVEATQAEFARDLRLLDTVHDLILGGAGLGLSVGINIAF